MNKDILKKAFLKLCTAKAMTELYEEKMFTPHQEVMKPYK